MCEALEELFADELEEKRKIGEAIGKEIGKKIGKEIATKRVNALIAKLLEQNRLDDIAKAVKDQVYQEKLFEEFEL